jgi:Tol biopolymer transport system component
MSLAAGTKLGPYEIVAPLGAGGMGEVYRARDTRLGRDVAVKVLPEHLSSNPEIRARFEREARAVSSLNHPHICTLHDVGREGPTDYLVMELVEGETLAQRLTRGPLPPADVLKVGAQIADALDRAHRAGVTHRDLKPGNVMLTKSGAKLMDFGLARATGLGAPSELTSSPTVAAPLTAEGTILGTFQYMAPEQLEGHESDARADLWALGCVLYEMATGKRAFEGATQASLISSIMRDQPRAMSELSRLTPKRLERVVKQCLAKDPDERWQSARDVVHELTWIAEEGSKPDATAAGGAATPRRAGYRLAVAAALILAAVVGGAAFIAGSRQQRGTGPATPEFRQISYVQQTVFNARFAPDGRSVIFSGALEGTVPELFQIQAEFPEPRALGLRDVQLLSISSRGEMAVLTDARFEGAHRIFTGTLATLPIGSEAPRAVLEEVRDADWSPDGSKLAIIRNVGGVDRLEFPIGTSLYQAPGYLSDPRVSPAGDRIAFFEHPVRWDDRGKVVVVDLKGRAFVLAEGFESIEGLAWDAAGERVLFAATRAGSSAFSVFTATLGGRLSVALPSPSGLAFYDARSDGRWLLAREDMRNEVRVLAPGAKEERDLSWLDFGDQPSLSPDGKTLLFTEQGEAAGPYYAVCMRRTDGSPVVRLGDGGSRGFSPDGKWALALVHSSPPKLMRYPTGAGVQREIGPGAFASVLSATWFPDGTKILVCGSRAAEPSRCFALDLDGGLPRPVTPEGTSDGWVSPDGKTALALSPSGKYVLYPLDGSAPRPVPPMTPRDRILGWSSDGRSIVVGALSSVPARVEKLALATGARTPVVDLAPADRSGALFIYWAGFSDDERSYAYSLVRNHSYLYEVAPGR